MIFRLVVNYHHFGPLAVLRQLRPNLRQNSHYQRPPAYCFSDPWTPIWQPPTSVRGLESFHQPPEHDALDYLFYLHTHHQFHFYYLASQQAHPIDLFEHPNFDYFTLYFNLPPQFFVGSWSEYWTVHSCTWSSWGEQKWVSSSARRTESMFAKSRWNRQFQRSRARSEFSPIRESYTLSRDAIWFGCDRGESQLERKVGKQKVWIHIGPCPVVCRNHLCFIFCVQHLLQVYPQFTIFSYFAKLELKLFYFLKIFQLPILHSVLLWRYNFPLFKQFVAQIVYLYNLH